jgi:hypothetical protein
LSFFDVYGLSGQLVAELKLVTCCRRAFSLKAFKLDEDYGYFIPGDFRLLALAASENPFHPNHFKLTSMYGMSKHRFRRVGPAAP